jgi:hypothetical protein
LDTAGNRAQAEASRLETPFTEDTFKVLKIPTPPLTLGAVMLLVWMVLKRAEPPNKEGVIKLLATAFTVERFVLRRLVSVAAGDVRLVINAAVSDWMLSALKMF